MFLSVLDVGVWFLNRRFVLSQKEQNKVGMVSKVRIISYRLPVRLANVSNGWHPDLSCISSIDKISYRPAICFELNGCNI